jgi:RNA polymerase-binding transcription factor DksA
MKKEFVEEMKEKLLEMKSEILRNLMSEDEEFKDIVDKDDSKDLVDIASSDIDKTTLEALGAQELKRLRLIESALVRIENGKYGLSLKSGQPIPEARLRAIPYALYSIEEQNELERRNR